MTKDDWPIYVVTLKNLGSYAVSCKDRNICTLRLGKEDSRELVNPKDYNGKVLNEDEFYNLHLAISMADQPSVLNSDRRVSIPIISPDPFNPEEWLAARGLPREDFYESGDLSFKASDLREWVSHTIKTLLGVKND